MRVHADPITTAFRQPRGVGNPRRVLLVEDDPATRQMVTRYFASYDIPTSAAGTRAEMDRCLAAEDPALIILNLRLGRDNGLDLLRSIRASSDVPVIMAGDQRPDEIECVLGLELGADDFIAKPFGMRELLARMRAILRRQRLEQRSKERGPTLGGYTFGGWSLEHATRQLTDPKGQLVTITKSEYALLVAFLERPQRVLTREQLLQATRVHENIFDRSIDVQILRLRRKLREDADAPRLILTERGVGYLFAPPVQSL
jgi:two-component system, OmpR family, response regulator